MEFFVDLPSAMTAKDYENLNKGLTICLAHILRTGRIWAEDKESFIEKLKESDRVAYAFVTRAISAMLNAPLDNNQVKENLAYLGSMLIGSDQATTNASKLFTGLYHEEIILNWPDIIKRLSNPKVNIHDDEMLMKEFNEKISIAENWEKQLSGGKEQA